MSMKGICVLFLAAAAMANVADAQRQAEANGKKAERPADVRTTAPPAENWGVLNDLKTGLQPTMAAIVQHDEEAEFVRELIRVEWRPGDPIELWITRPKVTGKAPVILYLYSYGDTSERFHDNGWCKRASADGFAAVGFVSALTDYRFRDRPMKQWFVSELPESLGSSVHDVQLVLNYLASREDMDMDHVGMFGMGSGATVAMLAAHVDPRIKALDLLDPWGDWPNWLELSPAVPDAERPKYLTAGFLKSVAVLDPIAYLLSLKTPSIRLQQTLSEPVTPKIVKERIRSAAPNAAQLVKYTNAGDLLNAWKISGLSGWIKEQMHSQKPKEVAIGGSQTEK